MKKIFLLATLTINAHALEDKAFNKALGKLRTAQKLGHCLDEAKHYADSIRQGNDDSAALDSCLKQAKRFERLKKVGF